MNKILNIIIILSCLINIVHSNSVITILANNSNSMGNYMIALDKVNKGSISIRKIDNPSKSISFTYEGDYITCSDDYKCNLFENEPGMYEIKITTNEKALSLSGLIGSYCNFDSVIIENSGDKINITDLSLAFSNCPKLKTVDLTNFDLSEVTNFRYIFYGCKNLVSVKFGNFKTQKLENMYRMFWGCSNLLSLDLSPLDISNVTNMEYLFKDCINLKYLNLSTFDTSKVTSFLSMFYNCSSLTSLNLSNFMTPATLKMNEMFYYCEWLENLNIENFNFSLVYNTSYMFYNCKKLAYLEIKNFEVNDLNNMESMFYGCVSLSSIDFNKFIVNGVSNVSKIFYNCFNLKSLDLSNFNTSLITNMESFFYGLKSLSYLNINNFDTRRVTTMTNMFKYCGSLFSLNLSSFSISDTTIVDNMFLNTENFIYCINDEFYEKIKSQLEDKNCLVRDFNCIPDWRVVPKKIIYENGQCVEDCNLTDNYKYEYEGKCYSSCPRGTTTHFNKNNNLVCKNFDEILKIIENEEQTEARTEEKTEVQTEAQTEVKTESKTQEKTEAQTEAQTEVKTESQTQEPTEEKTKAKTEAQTEVKTEAQTQAQTEEKTGVKAETKTEVQTETQTGAKTEEQSEEIKVDNNINNKFNKFCDPNDFFKNKCVPPQQYDNMITLIKNSIAEGKMNDLLKYVLNNKKDIIQSNDNIIYQITSTYNQKNNEYDNISTIALDECEEELKRIYNISKKVTLIIFKYDYNISDLLIPIIGYEIYHPITNEILDLNLCQKNKSKIDLLIPVKINESELYKHNPNDSYYIGKCNIDSNNKSFDITLYDKKNIYNEKNLALCPNNCEFEEYNNETKKVKCTCEPQYNNSLITLDNIINKRKLLNNFIDIHSSTNLDIIKCYKKLLKFEGLINNIGSYILFFIILLHR